jgi:hypothetical protein
MGWVCSEGGAERKCIYNFGGGSSWKVAAWKTEQDVKRKYDDESWEDRFSGWELGEGFLSTVDLWC